MLSDTGVGLTSPLPLSLFIMAAMEKLVILIFSVELQPKEFLTVTTSEEVTVVGIEAAVLAETAAAETAKFVEIIYFLF